ARPVISSFSSTIRLISDSDFFVCSRSGNATLSYRFIEPNNAPSWNNTPNSFRVSYSRCSEHVTMSTPLITQEPRSGFSKPIIDFKNTDLPVPDGPNITETSPGGSVNDTSRQMACLPKDLVKPSMTTSAPINTPRRVDLPGLCRVATPVSMVTRANHGLRGPRTPDLDRIPVDGRRDGPRQPARPPCTSG